jgi:hypothetical protein
MYGNLLFHFDAVFLGDQRTCSKRNEITVLCYLSNCGRSHKCFDAANGNSVIGR